MADTDVTQEQNLEIQVETERTFEVPDGWDLPSLIGVGAVHSVDDPARFTQTATYLDTPRLTLLRARHTLRRRTGGVDAGWHLKTPAGQDNRREHRAPLGRSAARVPNPLRAVVAELVKTAPLLPVAILATDRTRWLLRDESGRPVAEVVDDRVEATVLASVDARGEEHVLSWREVELELGDAGTDADFEALSGRLEDEGLGRSTQPSKLAKALAEPLARFAEHDQGEDGNARGGDEGVTLGRAVLDYLGAQLGMLQARDAEVRVDVPDAVHKSRVATRRTRSALKTFRNVFDRDITDPLRSELGWFAGVLGEARDAEVLRKRFTGRLDELAKEAGGRGNPLQKRPLATARRRLLGMIEDDHQAGLARSIAALDSPRYERILEVFTELLLHPPFTPGDDASKDRGGQKSGGAKGAKKGGAKKGGGRDAGDERPEKAAGRSVRPADQALGKYLRKTAARVTQEAEKARVAEAAQRELLLHEVRKDAKAARYAGEAAAPVLGEKSAATPAWEKVQDALGDIQDGVVARDLIARAVADARKAGEDTYVYGVLSERERGASARIEEATDHLLDQALSGAFAT